MINDKKHKICFYARAGQLPLYVKVAERLVEKNIDFFFVTQEKKETDFINDRITGAKIYEIERYLAQNWDSTNCQISNDILESFSELNFWRMIYMDRFLVYYSKEDCIKMINLHFGFFMEIFDVEKPDYFINESVAIFASHVALVVGEKYGCSYVGTIMARDNSKNQFFFFDNLYQKNNSMELLYFKNEFNQSELASAKDYLNEFRIASNSPVYMSSHKKPPKLTIKKMLYPIKYLLYRHKKMFRDKCAYMTYNKAFDIINEPLLNYIRYKLSVKFYQKPVEGEKYYLYTLHYQPEASTLVCAQKYEKQLLAIDNIAKSIPNDSILYVKEHYAVLGHRELNFYKELSKYPNVRLINPYEDVHCLIKNCLALIVLTSTTGFEGILHGKKVFVLGEVFYDFFDNVEKISDVYSEYLKLKDIAVSANDDKVIKFIAAYKKSLYDGCAYPNFSEYLTDTNVDKLIEGFRKYIYNVNTQM